MTKKPKPIAGGYDANGEPVELQDLVQTWMHRDFDDPTIHWMDLSDDEPIGPTSPESE